MNDDTGVSPTTVIELAWDFEEDEAERWLRLSMEALDCSW